MAKWRHYGDWTISLLSWTVFTQMYREDKDTESLYVEFKSGLSSYYQKEGAHQELKQKIAQKVSNDPTYLDKKLVDLAKLLKKDVVELRRINSDLKKKSAEVSALFRRYWESYRTVVFGLAIDIYFDDVVCAELEKFLKTRLAILGKSEKFNEHYATLTAPDEMTRSQSEELEFLKILLLSHSRQKASLEKHLKEFAYIPMWFDNVPWTIADFQARAGLYKDTDGIRRRILELRKDVDERNKSVRRILKELKPTKSEIALIERIRRFAFLRQEGELQIGYHNFHGIPLKEKIAKKLGLAAYDLTFLTDDEIEKNVQYKDPHLAEMVHERKKHSFLISQKGVCKVYIGAEAQKIVDDIRRDLPVDDKTKQKSTVSELSGVVGSVGYAKGKVRVVRGLQDIPKFLHGEILVVSGTSVEYLSAMQRSAAIIAEIGGITSHAAVISRELGKPCLTRVAGATTILKDGELVEVDGKRGIVKRLDI